REAERAVDARLELLGDDVLEPIGLFVHVVDVHAERLREIELEQAVVPDDLERDALARRRERDAAVRLVLCEAERGELLHHRARRRRRYLLRTGERADGDAVARLRELVDLAEVVLNRLGQRLLRHSYRVRE